MCHRVLAKVGDPRDPSLFRKVTPPFPVSPAASDAAGGGAVPNQARANSHEAEAVVVECLEGEASASLAGFPDFHLHNQRREDLFTAANKSDDGITIQVSEVTPTLFTLNMTFR